MKKFITILIAAVLLSLTACGDGRGGGETSVEVPEGSEFPEFAFPYEFAMTDLFGNEITQSDLGNKRAFFVYHWATWCGPCVASMPTLAELAEQFGDSVGFIGLIGDFESNADTARNIVQSSNLPANFRMVNANSPAVAALLADVRSGFYPTAAILTANNVFPDTITGRVNERHRDILNAISA